MKSPLFKSALMVLGLVFAGEIHAILASRKTAGHAQARLELKLHELEQCEAAMPALTRENAVAIETDLTRARDVLAAMEAGLKAQGGAVAPRQNSPVPPTRTDAFFDLATFVEKTRERAARSGVALKSDERFGFSSYATEGPAAELIPAVFRQRLVVQHFVEVLLDAHPHRLISIQREFPTVVPVDPHAAGGSRPQLLVADRLPPDFFVIDPRLSVRLPGAVETMAFRVAFVGSTGTLRTFLNQLAGFELPIIVRCVEVEPAAATDTAQIEPAASGQKSIVLSAEPAGRATDSSVPVVVPALSRFIVTVEFIGLAPGTGPVPSKVAASPSA